MQFNTNRIVWLLVLKYLEIHLDDDTPEEISLKRRTILSIALTGGKDVVEMALSRLWKSMETLEPVSLVFNTSLTPFDNLSEHQGRQNQVPMDLVSPFRTVGRFGYPDILARILNSVQFKTSDPTLPVQSSTSLVSASSISPRSPTTPESSFSCWACLDPDASVQI